MALIDQFVSVAEESPYGTAASLSRGVLCNPSEFVLTEDMQRIMSTVRIPGQLANSSVFAKAFMGVAGSGAFDCLDKGMGLWLKHAFGGFASIDHPVATGVMKRMTFTPDAAAKLGLSLTAQLFKTFADSSGRAQTYTGVKVLGVRFMGDVGGLVRMSVTLDGRDVYTSGDTISGTLTSGNANVTVTSTTGLYPGMRITGTGIPANSFIKSITSATVFVLGDSSNASVNASASGANTLTVSRGSVIAKVSSPTYPSDPQPFSWNGIGITVDGVQCCAGGFEVAYDFTMRTDRHHMCNSGLKDEPVVIDISKATLSLKGLEALAWTDAGANREYSRYMSLTPAQSLANCVITCYTPGLRSGVTKGKLEFQIPTALATSGPQDMGGTQPAEFEIIGTPGLTVVYDTLDSAP
jgi:hypothetical protein